jgi:hypothetical protein
LTTTWFRFPPFEAHSGSSRKFSPAPLWPSAGIVAYANLSLAIAGMK